MSDTRELKQQAGLTPYERRLTLIKKGKEYRAQCLWHYPDKHPSLSVFQKGGEWFFKCWVCHESGDVISLVMKRDSLPFRAAVRVIAKECGWTTF